MSCSQNPHQSSSSESDLMSASATDIRKRKRMLSNRESARRSRMRKQQRLEELISQSATLRSENERIAAQIEAISGRYEEVESGNAILRTQLMELTDRLKSVNSLLLFLEDFSGVAMDIPEIPDPLLKPWQLPCPAQLLLASHDALQY